MNEPVSEVTNLSKTKRNVVIATARLVRATGPPTKAELGRYLRHVRGKPMSIPVYTAVAQLTDTGFVAVRDYDGGEVCVLSDRGEQALAAYQMWAQGETVVGGHPALAPDPLGVGD